MSDLDDRANDAHGDERLRLIAIGRNLPLRQAVREFLAVADEMLEPKKRPPQAHGGAYMSRWRFERLRQSLMVADAEVENLFRPAMEAPDKDHLAMLGLSDDPAQASAVLVPVAPPESKESK